MQKLDIDKRDHALSILERFNALREEEKGCDFVIKVSEKEMKVHRTVLMAGSDYFDAMLSHDTMEKENGIVEMKDVSFSLVQKCVDFIYTGEIEVSVEECDDLLYVVNTMQLQAVRAKISGFLEGSLMPILFQNIRNIALKYGLERLGSACDEYALKNMDLLTKQGSFSLFDLKYVMFLFSSKSHAVYGYSEESKLAILIDWIKADAANRQSHLMALVNLVDLSKISNPFGKYLVEVEPICSCSTEFIKKLYLSGMGKHVSALSVTVDRHIPNAILLFYQSHKGLSAYRPDHNSITELQETEHVGNNNSFFAISSKNRVYVLTSDGRFFMLEIQGYTWVTKPDMGTQHGKNLRATFYGDNIYVCGEGILEKFSIPNNEWETVRSDVHCRDECEIVNFDDNILCIGGKFLHEATNKVDAFNPLSKSWTSYSCMRTKRRTPAAISFKGKLYVAGGYDGKRLLSTVEVYDSESGLWTIIEPMKVAHDEFNLCVVENKLYAMSSRRADVTEVYDDDGKKWEVVKALSEKEISAGIPVFLPDVVLT